MCSLELTLFPCPHLTPCFPDIFYDFTPVFARAEGEEVASTGFFTLSSVWQSYNTFFFANEGDRVAFTLCPTAALPRIRQTLATVAGMGNPNPNRGVHGLSTHTTCT